jgi:predicted DNA-binding protein
MQPNLSGCMDTPRRRHVRTTKWRHRCTKSADPLLKTSAASGKPHRLGGPVRAGPAPTATKGEDHTVARNQGASVTGQALPVRTSRRFDVETKIRLTSRQRSGLDTLVHRRGTTRAQEIRRSIDRYLAALDAPELRDALDVLAVLDDAPDAGNTSREVAG